jgi:surfeit locus 1 family protein
LPFRPAPIPTVASAIALVILLNLGFWQLRRDAAQTLRIAEVERVLHDPPVGNERLSEPPASLAWRRARLTGHFDTNGPVFAITNRFELNQRGLDLVEVFHADGVGPLLVNRGWIPHDQWQTHLTATRPTGESITVEGLLLPLPDDATAKPIPADDNGPERWAMGAEAAMAARVPGALPLYLTAGESYDSPKKKRHDSLPVSGYIAKPKTISHFDYALTWFQIAGVLVALWTWSGIRRGAAMASEVLPKAD